MAPITATAVGVSPQTLDDAALRQLLASLNALDGTDWTVSGATCSAAAAVLPVNKPAVLDELCRLLEPYRDWAFEEQVRIGSKWGSVYTYIYKYE